MTHNIFQKGGFEPFMKLPEFKYTFDENRKTFVSHIYPFADYFIKCVTSIPFDTYSYKGPCELIQWQDEWKEPKKQIIFDCKTSGNVSYGFTGGCVYELLNNKYKTPNLHDYCDATGDFDVKVQAPKLLRVKHPGIKNDEEYDEYFFNKDEKVNMFYRHFIFWIFKQFIITVKRNLYAFKNYKEIVDFDLKEYVDIPIDHKIKDLRYLQAKIHNKFYVVAFLNENKSNPMFKIQLVLKIESNGISAIDHAIEMIIPLNATWPTSNEYCITDDSYTPRDEFPLTINGNKYQVQNYNSLIHDNVDAYGKRKQVFGSSNERQNRHKPLNHIARMLYLYELLYQNQSTIDSSKINLALLAPTESIFDSIRKLVYYKRTSDDIQLIKIDLITYLRAYSEIIQKNKYGFKNFKRLTAWFLNDQTFFDNIAKDEHDKFIASYGNPSYSLSTSRKSNSRKSNSRSNSRRNSNSRKSNSRRNSRKSNSRKSNSRKSNST
jgi:hypothetical protein